MRRVVAWSLVVLWCLVIFSFSSEDRLDSHERSKEVTEIVEGIMVSVLDIGDINIGLDRSLEHYVRKASHVLIYFILTIFIFYALTLSRIKGYKRYILTLILAISYAFLDELHQAYVPGRGPQIEDVFIDGIGVVLGLFLVFISKKNIFHLQ